MPRYVVTALAAAFIVIVSPTDGRTNPDRDETVEVKPIAVQRMSTPSGMRDEVAMVLIGTGLLAVAAAVRRAA